MAGRPKRRVLMGELERRTREEFADESGECIATHLDYAVSWVASGKTIRALAEDIAATLGESMSREFVSRYFHTAFGDEANQRLTEARARGAHALVEEAQAIVDAAPEQREALQKAKMRADMRTWLSERWNREEFGAPKGAHLQIDVAQLHINAMRAHSVKRSAERAELANGTPTAGDAAGLLSGHTLDANV